MQKVRGSIPLGSTRCVPVALIEPSGLTRGKPHRLTRVTSRASSVLSDPESAKPVEGESKGIPVPMLMGDNAGMPDQQFFVYIIQCADGTYYVGSTTDVPTRVDAHNAKLGPQFTACRCPVELVYSESLGTMAQARRREVQIKKWSRAKKQALIRGDEQTLRSLSRRKSR